MLRLTLKGFKARDRVIHLDRLTFLGWPNEEGKSAILEAFLFLFLGYVPRLGKTAALTAVLMRGPEMSVELLLPDGRTARRIQKTTGDGYTTEVSCSWVDSKKKSEHEAELLKLVGEDETSVAECLDIKSLALAPSNQRNGRIQKLIGAQVDVGRVSARIARYTVQRLVGIDDTHMPEDYGDLLQEPYIADRALEVLGQVETDLLAKLQDGGLVAAQGWAREKRNVAIDEMEKKTQARAALAPRLQELRESTEEERARVSGERDAVQRQVGAAEERGRQAEERQTAITAALAGVDAALRSRAAARTERTKFEPRASRLAEQRAKLTAIESDLDALKPPPPPDTSSTTALKKRAKAEEDAASAVKLPEVPTLVESEIRLEAARRDYQATVDSPWAATLRDVDELAKALEGAKLKDRISVDALIECLRARAAELRQSPDEAVRTLEDAAAAHDRLVEEVQEKTRDRDAALAKANAHLDEAKRLRKAATDLETTATNEHRAAMDAHAVRHTELKRERDELRTEVKALDKDDSATAAALTEAEAAVVAAEKHRTGLGDTATEIDAGVEPLKADLERLTKELSELVDGAAARSEIKRLVLEIEQHGAESKVYAALDHALQRVRNEELAEAGGPLIAGMKRFLRAAGREETPYFDPKETNREIGWRSPLGPVAVAAMCDSQFALYATALCVATVIIRSAPLRLLLVEADACGPENLQALLEGIAAVSDDLSHAVVATHQSVPMVDGVPAVQGWDVPELPASLGTRAA